MRVSGVEATGFFSSAAPSGIVQVFAWGATLAHAERTTGEDTAVALLKFESGVQEIFAVALLSRRYPDLMNDEDKVLESSFVVPTECLGEVAATVRSSEPVLAERGRKPE